MDCLLTVIEHWRMCEQTVHYRKFAAPSVRTVGPGRPKFEIKLEQLEEDTLDSPGLILQNY